MQVLLVCSSYLPNIGGLQSVVSALAHDLHQHGNLITVLAQRYPRTLPADEEIDGIRVHRLLFLSPRLHNLRNRRFALFFAGFIHFPHTLIRLLWLILHDKPDVVNLHFVGTPAPFVLIARKLMCFRFVVSLHGDDVEGLPRGTWFDRWVFCSTLRCADAVTACSRYLLERAQAIEPRMAHKAHVVYNGISFENFGTVASTDTILAAGRMVPKKGFDVLLRAFAEYCHTTNTMRLNLIGDGPERCALESLARELGLTDQVTFLGAREHAFVIRAIQTSRFVVVPSREEPFGLVALEAMAVGKPVIATRVGGLPEVLEGADAILVEPNNPAALANAIIGLFQRIQSEPRFGANNRAIASRFSIEQMMADYTKIYRKEIL